jgi:two-component sensor histidine kinase
MFEVTHVTKDGDRIPVEVNAHLFDLHGEPTVLAIARDITRRKRVEAELRAALLEKDVLLREVHHRVKNNLQVISSLMDLQSGYIANEQILRMFQESQNRVKSMALIHEKLYQSAGLTRIDFETYLQNLTAHLFRSFGVSAYMVTLRLDVQDVFLDLDMAVPCALIINELVSNALKYAFPDSWRQTRDDEAKVWITLHKEADDLVLIVGDNGIGLPAGLDMARANSLGLRLVSMLARQLKATLDIEGGNGTTFKLTFPMSSQ